MIGLSDRTYTDLSKIWNVTLINSNLLGLQKEKGGGKKSVLLYVVAMKIRKTSV